MIPILDKYKLESKIWISENPNYPPHMSLRKSLISKCRWFNFLLKVASALFKIMIYHFIWILLVESRGLIGYTLKKIILICLFELRNRKWTRSTSSSDVISTRTAAMMPERVPRCVQNLGEPSLPETDITLILHFPKNTLTFVL